MGNPTRHQISCFKTQFSRRNTFRKRLLQIGEVQTMRKEKSWRNHLRNALYKKRWRYHPFTQRPAQSKAFPRGCWLAWSLGHVKPPSLLQPTVNILLFCICCPWKKTHSLEFLTLDTIYNSKTYFWFMIFSWIVAFTCHFATKVIQFLQAGNEVQPYTLQYDSCDF